jgi:recombination protein RecR
MDPLKKLEQYFTNFPGIGPRQAKRFAYFMMSRSKSSIDEFIKILQESRSSVSECDTCHRLFVNKNNTEIKTCSICIDKNRDSETLMIVSRDFDLENIEKSGNYKGQYFVLGGIIPILDKEPEKRVRIKQLLNFLKNKNHLTEIIISTSATTDGEHTADTIKAKIRSMGDVFSGIKITVLGRGISTGAELEYIDGDTIKNALKNRSVL